MSTSFAKPGWSVRTGLVCLVWVLLLASMLGQKRAPLLVVIGVLLVLGGSEWVVRGLQIEERWRRITTFVMMVLLLSVSFVAISGMWVLGAVQLFNPG
jgi:hypothetical protein